jgi:hypothetical protein
MGGNGSPRAEVRTNLGTYSQGVALGCYVWALSGHRHADTMTRSPDFGLKGQPHASQGQRPVHYPQPYNLVPTLPRGNAVFDALRRTHSVDYQSVATSTSDSIRA